MKNDLISRQAAIDAVHKDYDTILDFKSDGATVASSIEDILLELPPAQPNLQPTCNQLATDCISRQAAIDAIGERPMVWTDDDQYALGERNQYDRDRLAIETLPSAEKKGKWISDEDGNIYCSVCGKTGVGESFCEHCGANMKGEEE